MQCRLLILMQGATNTFRMFGRFNDFDYVVFFHFFIFRFAQHCWCCCAFFNKTKKRIELEVLLKLDSELDSEAQNSHDNI